MSFEWSWCLYINLAMPAAFSAGQRPIFDLLYAERHRELGRAMMRADMALALASRLARGKRKFR